MCGMLTFMSLMLLTVKPNNTINKKRLKEVRGMGRGLDSKENPQESQKYSPDFFFSTIFLCTKMFPYGLNLSTFLYKTSGLKSGCQISK